MHGVTSHEDGLPSIKFRKDAPNGPYVDGLVVRLVGQKQFWRPVPSCSNIICYMGLYARITLEKLGMDTSGETKIANLQTPIQSAQNVSRLQIPMDDICAVYVLQPAQDLVKKVFDVKLRELHRGVYDLGQIVVDKFLVAVQSVIGRARHYLEINQIDNVLMALEEVHELQLADRPFQKNLLVEDVADLFNRDLGGRVLSFKLHGTHGPIGAPAQELDDLVMSRNGNSLLGKNGPLLSYDETGGYIYGPGIVCEHAIHSWSVEHVHTSMNMLYRTTLYTVQSVTN